VKVFIDSDVAVKLAQWGLLDRFQLHLTKQGGATVYTLATLKYRFKLQDPAKAAALVGSSAAVAQLQRFAAACAEPKGFNADVATALHGVPGIDAGEAQLLATAAQFDSVLVDTGDKKALRALGILSASGPVAKELGGKLACLEQTLSYLCTRWSFSTVQGAVTSAPSADSFCHRAFSASSEQQTLGALSAEATALGLACPGLLNAKPFAWVPT